MLGMLVEGFTAFLEASQGKWLVQFPHFMAELCEKANDDERRRDLFLYVVYSSLASDTVSAIQRLLQGTQKAKFVTLVKEYREHVESTWAQYPPWVQGRMRGLLASFRVV